MNDLEKIEKIKNKLEDSKQKLANIQGKISAKCDQLADMGFNPKSKNLMDSVKDELDLLNHEIEDGYKKLDIMVEDFKSRYPTLFEE